MSIHCAKNLSPITRCTQKLLFLFWFKKFFQKKKKRKTSNCYWEKKRSVLWIWGNRTHAPGTPSCRNNLQHAQPLCSSAGMRKRRSYAARTTGMPVPETFKKGCCCLRTLLRSPLSASVVGRRLDVFQRSRPQAPTHRRCRSSAEGTQNTQTKTRRSHQMRQHHPAKRQDATVVLKIGRGVFHSTPRFFS